MSAWAGSERGLGRAALERGVQRLGVGGGRLGDLRCERECQRGHEALGEQGRCEKAHGGLGKGWDARFDENPQTPSYPKKRRR